jgi:hypothetical protein
MAVHLGQVLVDVQASDPTAQLLPLGRRCHCRCVCSGRPPGDLLLSPQIGAGRGCSNCADGRGQRA